MYNFDADAVARTMIEGRIRDAEHRHLARELKRAARPIKPEPAIRAPRRHSRLWTGVHFRHSYS